MSDPNQQGISRRSFLKMAGFAGIALQAGGLLAAGKAAGENPETYTGWESFNPSTQFFNRKPFEFEGPSYTPVSEVRRPSLLADYVFGRVATFGAAIKEHPDWKMGDPVETLGLPEKINTFYAEFPERLEWDFKTVTETLPTNAEDRAKYENYYMLADAYSWGFESHRKCLPVPQDPPEISDYTPAVGAGTERIGEPVPFKSPALASEFISEIAHRYGATLVRITKPNIDFFYSEGWRGCPEDYDFSKLPDHWQYAIVLGVPMEWDVVLSSPQASTSYEGYDRVSTAAFRLENALKYLGYPARSHTPFTNYDLVIPPLAVEAGMGELGRTGYCITPELGGNCRMAVVTTNIPMEINKPVHFGVKEFCDKCKLCAEGCPSGSISTADSPKGMEIRGYEHWYINNGSCYNFWRESLGPMGCRLCVATCPFSRKDNWLHQMARTTDSMDPTGIVNSGLIWMQKTFFDAPEAIDYRRQPEGTFASYREEPTFLHADRYLDIDITNPHKGE